MTLFTESENMAGMCTNYNKAQYGLGSSKAESQPHGILISSTCHVTQWEVQERRINSEHITCTDEHHYYY